MLGLPDYTANLLHQLSTTKNGATYPPINTRQTGQKKLYQPGQILPLLPVFFVVSGYVGPLFILHGQTVKLKPSAVFLIRCLWSSNTLVSSKHKNSEKYCYKLSPQKTTLKRLVAKLFSGWKSRNQSTLISVTWSH